MTVHLPLFPLGLVAFQGEKVNLHIFEPRYKQLITECFEEDKTFGIVPYLEGEDMQIGTEMNLIEISHIYDDGKMDIKTQGVRVFRIESFQTKMDDKLYPGGMVHFDVPVSTRPSILEVQEVISLLEKMYDILGLELPFQGWDESYSLYEIGHKLGFSLSEEIHFLGLASEADRFEYTKAHLKKMIPVVEKMESIKKRVKMNGHFKNIMPPNL